ncbi:hypothetical protein BGZ89_008590 [Linnemannia elongata]|nr:hypothetical protein BGZ89_008590 [Linnemannia elongata]
MLQDVYTQLNVPELSTNKNDGMFLDLMSRHHLIDVLKRRHHKFKNVNGPNPSIDPLPPTKTKTHPLPAMRIDQSSVEGNKAVLDDLIKILELGEEHFQVGKRILLGGDQLTISRLRTAIRQLRSASTSAKRLEWALPIIQLFHLQMSFALTIFKTHYGAPGVGGSLGDAIAVLGRKRLSKDNPNFHALDELIRHVFDSLALRAWQAVLRTDDIDSAVDGLNDDALQALVTENVDRILVQFLSTSPNNERDGALAEEEATPLTGTASRNAAVFLRDAILYVELWAAIKGGDIGRIEGVLRWMTVMFQAGLNKNYGYELLHLQCGLLHAWPPEAKKAVLSSMLVNTKGKKNGFLATDMYQEHCNLATKHIYAAKGGNLAWETLREKISTIIEVFPDLKAKLRAEFNLKHSNAKHSTVDSTDEMTNLLKRLKDHGIFSWEQRVGRPAREAAAVVDLLDRGMTNLQTGGRLDSFRKAFARRERRVQSEDQRPIVFDDEMEFDEAEDDEMRMIFDEIREEIEEELRLHEDLE